MVGQGPMDVGAAQNSDRIAMGSAGRPPEDRRASYPPGPLNDTCPSFPPSSLPIPAIAAMVQIKVRGSTIFLL